MEKYAVICQDETSSIQKIIVFGGTFNPIHEGHVSLLYQAFHEIHPEKIIIVPTGIPPYKGNQLLASAHDRLAMCKLATCDYSFVETDDYEQRMGSTSYTVDTLYHMKRRFPDAVLYLLMGTDLFLKFDTWYKWRQCSELAILLVGSRYMGDANDIQKQQQHLNSLGVRSRILSNKTIYTSSTKIRRVYSDNEDVIQSDTVQMLHLDVRKYILKKGLYRHVKNKIM